MLFGQSRAMLVVRQRLAKAAGTNLAILIEGEGGTGKEVLARWIHANSPWRDGPFVKVACAAIPGGLLESELFGYEKGAFTGAHSHKSGRVEQAHGGTLFLDGIAEFDYSLQSKLLQFLQDGRFSRIGDDEEKKVEARFICATARKLELEIDGGRFRADLFYRINGLRIQLPRLKERREDLPQLVDYFLKVYQSRFEKEAPPITKQLLERFQSLDWPGNIRELENTIARYVILGADEHSEIPMPQVNPRKAVITSRGDGSIPLKRIAKEAVREMERKLILEFLQANQWNRRKTAEALRISYRALIYKIRESGLKSKRTPTEYKNGD